MGIQDLRITNEGEAAPADVITPPRRRWLTRVVLPLVILLMTAGLLAYAARDALLPATTVETVRVVVREGFESGQAADTSRVAGVSVQAAGWIEPDPYPIYVSALASGVIERLHVLEGQMVTAGQMVAEMVDDDARLALARAQAELDRRQAVLAAAQTDWDNPVELERAVAVSQAQLTQAQSQQAELEAMILQERARLRELQVTYDRLSSAGAESVAQLEIDQAQHRVEAQEALLEATIKQRPVLEALVRQHEAEVKAAARDLELRVDLRQSLDEALAVVHQATAVRDEAQLRLERMQIVAPVDGVVMDRMVAPGSKIMFNMDDMHSAHVVHLYDPNRLQVRVDVPLADAAKVGLEQPAQIVVDALPDRIFEGHLSRLVHQADISKNTVQVKVAIKDPTDLLKPDMLARVKFLAQLQPSTTAQPASHVTVYAPESAIVQSQQQMFVWVIIPGQSRLQKQPVVTGVARADGWFAILEGLHPGDLLVANPQEHLKENQRVQTTDVN